ncbi:MAG: c-type cytochrome [Phenylobacterium sp.]|uniref:c-type cytochrome n=1 Tax=Phenylobacterium sp. TaxID=1871053 RepID=UPI0027211B8C|nr:c-type cytochrome [Phenylobacterium sp.]MDO8901141.1 c-type cytochrome [Phenylobacterium sp.]MDP2214824.1 c-type cytochrome [Phenylobacterium sp.]
MTPSVRAPSFRLPALLAGLVLAAAPGLVLAQAPASSQGARLFNMQCKTCHGEKSTPAGPSLTGIAGGPIAGRDDYAYSPGLKAKGGTWTDAALDAYLAKPLAFAPGTRMMVAVPDANNRAAIVAYMKTLK